MRLEQWPSSSCFHAESAQTIRTERKDPKAQQQHKGRVHITSTRASLQPEKTKELYDQLVQRWISFFMKGIQPLERCHDLYGLASHAECMWWRWSEAGGLCIKLQTESFIQQELHRTRSHPVWVFLCILSLGELDHLPHFNSSSSLTTVLSRLL